MASTEQALEFAAQFVTRLEASACIEIVGERAVARVRYMAGDRVDRLDLAAIARRRARVDQQHVTRRTSAFELVEPDDLRAIQGQLDLGFGNRLRARFD